LISVPQKANLASDNRAAQQLEPNVSSRPDRAENVSNLSLSQVFNLLMWLYWFGVAAFGITFFIQVVTLITRVYAYPVIKDGRFTIVELPGNKAPCSFGNVIFINPEKYDWDTYNQILLHEKIHIQQKHSFDILLAEIALIFQWFNPFAWMYRKELENNLEFLTDDLMLSEGKVDRTSYQMNLLKVSAPHFPLSLTTNYNQSLLKKRVIMMTAKKSNINTTWKYLFLLPVLVISVCLLNKPVASAQLSEKKKTEKENTEDSKQLKTEGSWFATIKNDKLSIQFKNDHDHPGSYNGSTFPISEFKDFQREKSGTFTLTREAGTMHFTGKFDGERGMGTYKFIADKGFADYLAKEGIETGDDGEIMVLFMVDVKKSLVQMLKENGYAKLSRHELIPIAALKVDDAYIKSLKGAGLRDISIHDLIPLKSLGVTSEYIADIRKAGYPNVSVEKLITFKATGINGKFIDDVRHAGKKEGKPSIGEKTSVKDDEHDSDDTEEDDIDDIIAIKALNVDADYINSLKEAGYSNLENGDLVAMKAVGVTGDYIKSFQKMGYKNMKVSDFIGAKSQNITPEYAKSFEAVGYSNLSLEDLVPLKALGVTPAFIRNFQRAGIKQISLEDAVSLKAQGITPELLQEYKELGFADISVEDVGSAKATGTTPAFIRSMKEKGHNLKSYSKVHSNESGD
jgi:hypothetical protein